MPVQDSLVLILDANNLAHYIHHFPAKKTISVDDIRQLITQLSSYVREASQSIICELCLDYHHPDQILPILNGVRIFPAQPPEEADDLLLHRFRFHHHQGRDCLVITNDIGVCDKVKDEEGSYLLVNDFVRRSGNKPVFRDPIEFPALIHTHKKIDLLTTSRNLTRIEKTSQISPTSTSRLDPVEEYDTSLITQPENENATQIINSITPILYPQPAYCLSLETWPLDRGVRFLVNSFCRQHRDEYLELYRSVNPEDLRFADLVELVNALKNTCGTEPGFAARGSLLDRVRLALILCPDEAVPLSEIAKKTGLNEVGLQGRIKEKAKGWLRIKSTL